MGDLGQMGSSETELVEQLSAVGIKLASPPTDPHELLLLLNQTESFLSQVKQAPSESVFIALRPTIKAVGAEKLLNQSDMDLKIAIASCLAEITRITAPNAPYDNGLMKEVFQLIVDAFEKLNDISSPSYSKCVTILETIARSRLCVLLLDLEYDALVLEMFRHFLRTIRPGHPENVFSSMEAIMTHVLEESDDSELLSAFLSSLKMDQKGMSPIARHLVEKVINNCKELVQSTGISLSDYGCVVTSPCQENSNRVGQSQGEMERREIELVKQLLDVGVKLASPPTDPRELFSLLSQTQRFLAKVEQAPSESVFTALHPATKALVAENLLNQSDMDMNFAIASCLAEIIRITVPNAPYDDELMKEVFRLIVDAIKKLNDISSPSYSRRVEILEIVARTRLCLVLLDLECESLVLEMFCHFFKTLRPCHTGNVIFWMEDIMIHVIEESEDISSELLSCLLSSAKKDDKDVLPTARELVKRVMNNCASKLKPYLNEFIQSTRTSLSDYDSVVASLCEESSNALGYGSLERGVTCPEEICNDEELPTLVTRNLVSTINSNSVLVPVFPEQEPEKSSQIFQSQSAAMVCRADHDISSCSTDATLESLADHTTKSMQGRKSKSSILVDIHKKSQCAGDKEALAVYTKRTGKTIEAAGLQSNCPSGKEAEISTCSKPDKKTEIQSSSSLDRGKAFVSSASPVDSLPDISHPKRGQPSVFSAKLADQPASICVHKQTSENHQTTKELLTSNGIDTMKENKDSSDSQRKPLSSSRQKELKDTTCSGKSPIKRSSSRTETDRDSGSTPLELTSTKRSTMKESSSKQQYRKAIAEKDVSAGTSSNGSDSLERDVTCPEEIGNAEELARLVTRSLVSTINSNSMLVPACPEQEPEHSSQIFQSQSASIRADHNIPSCSTNATLESLADHSTKSMRGRKNKSSILVDTHKNSQCAGDKEALEVHTQGTGKTMEIDGLQSDCPSGKQAEISTCSKPDKKTEIQSSSKLDRRNTLVSSAAPVDNLPDISHLTRGQPSVFAAKQDITVVDDQPSSICVHKETSENRRTTKECLSHLSNQSKASKKGTGTMKENKDSCDSRRKPLPSSRQKELKEATCSGKSPIERIPSRMETDHDSVSTPLELTSDKRSTRNGSSSKQQTRKAIPETDVFAGTSSKVCATQIDEKECNQNLVGSRIEVWWPMDEKFYPGFVSAYYPDTKKHQIIYDDDDTEALTLKDERWKLVNVKGKNIRKPYVSSKRNAVVIGLESDDVSGSSKERREATTTQPNTSILGEESTPGTHHRRRGVSGSSKDRREATTTQPKTSVLREESTPDTHHQRRGVSGSSKDRREATTTQPKTSVLREESTPDTHHQRRGVSRSSKDRRDATTTQPKTSVLREESTPDTHHQMRGVSSSSKDRREATTKQPKTSVLREESTPDTHHRRRGVSGSSKDRRELKTYVSREESTANSLHRKRPVVECETKSSSPTTAEGRSNRVKRSVALERTSLISVDKTSSAIKTRTTGRKRSSNYPAVQDISPVPASTEQVKKASTEVSSLKRTLLQDEEIEDLSVVEAERRLQRGKRRKLDPVITDDVPTPLTPQASASDDPHVERIFTPAFTEKIRAFSLICRNKWYERNLEPLPDYAEFADEFGRDSAFDHGNLFKTIRQAPHYHGLDTSDTGLLLDLWYKLPLLIEALHRSVSSQNFLEKNKETIKGWLTKLTEAGFDISVPLAAFELLTIWPTNFVNFRESLDSVSRQLNEERQNLEALKLKLPVSERVAGLDLKIEDLKQQIRDLESERTSLVPLKSVELELEKYGTSMKAYRLQKLKELHEKELEEAKQFLQEVSLGGWYERIRLAPLAE